VSDPQAFDAVAAEYDATFTSRRLGRWLRDAVWERLAAAFQPGDHVLELGCGTGEDAIWLARRGLRVTATDVSPGMLAVARAKAAASGLGERLRWLPLDAGTLGRASDPQLAGPFAGAYSSFGALNCLPERRRLAAALAERVGPGGRLVLVMMGPLCPWEVAWHLAHGELNTARRRWRSGVVAHVGDGRTVQVWYPSPRTLRAELAPDWRLVDLAGVGALLPPTQLAHLAERWPRPFTTLALLERRFRRAWPWTWLNDHYLAVFERR
jgi:SAM-dependent methyltransferase